MCKDARTWTFDIHKVGVGTLDETLLLVPPLLLLRGWVQQVFCELNYKGGNKIDEISNITRDKNLKAGTQKSKVAFVKFTL